jgi:hypothetical protein
MEDGGALRVVAAVARRRSRLSVQAPSFVALTTVYRGSGKHHLNRVPKQEH